VAGTVHIAARLPPDLAAAFRRVCAEDERPVSNELRRLIRQRVAEDESARPAKPDAFPSGDQDRHESG